MNWHNLAAHINLALITTSSPEHNGGSSRRRKAIPLLQIVYWGLLCAWLPADLSVRRGAALIESGASTRTQSFYESDAWSHCGGGAWEPNSTWVAATAA